MFIKDGYRRHSCTSKTAKIHHFVKFVMYCFITTCSVECYWHYRDDAMSPLTVFYKFCFYIYSQFQIKNLGYD